MVLVWVMDVCVRLVDSVVEVFVVDLVVVLVPVVLVGVCVVVWNVVELV